MNRKLLILAITLSVCLSAVGQVITGGVSFSGGVQTASGGGGGGSFTDYASTFDGANTYLYKASGAISNYDGSAFVFSCWLKPSDYNAKAILLLGDAFIFYVYRNSDYTIRILTSDHTSAVRLDVTTSLTVLNNG